LAFLRQEFLQDAVGELLTFEGLSELLSTVLAESDGLVAARSLDVFLAEDVAGLIEVLGVGLEGSLQVLNLLINEAELKEETSNLRVILTDAGLENVESTVKVLETLREVATVVVVH